MTFKDDIIYNIWLIKYTILFVIIKLFKKNKDDLRSRKYLLIIKHAYKYMNNI